MVTTTGIQHPSGAVNHVVPKIQKDLVCAIRCDLRVLITGRSRAGARALARLIHRNSQRARGPFLAIDCASMPDVVLESKLFGRTGDSADRDRRGILERAHGGTIFIANIGTIGAALQARLLRFLEGGEIRRAGADVAHTRVDVRVISSAELQLFERTETMAFRPDLYYRLNVVHLVMPPIRRRRRADRSLAPR